MSLRSLLTQSTLQLLTKPIDSDHSIQRGNHTSAATYVIVRWRTLSLLNIEPLVESGL